MATKTTGKTDLPFLVIGVSGNIAMNIQVEFYPVAKLPIDLKASGAVGAGFHQFGEDLGAAPQTPSIPNPIKDLPPGVKEIYQP